MAPSYWGVPHYFITFNHPKSGTAYYTRLYLDESVMPNYFRATQKDLEEFIRKLQAREISYKPVQEWMAKYQLTPEEITEIHFSIGEEYDK